MFHITVEIFKGEEINCIRYIQLPETGSVLVFFVDCLNR